MTTDTIDTPFLRSWGKQRAQLRKLREANERRAAIPSAAIAAAAIHEAGHAVACVLAGGRITDVALTPDDPDHLGICNYEDGLTASAQAQITLAGPYAEARHTYGKTPSIREIRSILDGQCFADGTGDLDHLIASGEPFPYEVGRLIDTSWPAIVKIARHLVRNDRADHSTVCAALGIPEEGGHLSAAASAIRAGFQPAPR